MASTKGIAEKPTGRKQGQAYEDLLPKDSKKQFPNLSEYNSSLSKAMHEADGKAEVFDECRAKIEEHFDAIRLFKIKFE